ncbi:MAG: hypothetical protein WBL61_10000 [Bryobacteraceae bacterium]
MTSDEPVGTVFREGDPVVLASGTYQGTTGCFVRLRKDVNWADIKESNGNTRSHPMAWLAHSASLMPGSVSPRLNGVTA